MPEVPVPESGAEWVWIVVYVVPFAVSVQVVVYVVKPVVTGVVAELALETVPLEAEDKELPLAVDEEPKEALLEDEEPVTGLSGEVLERLLLLLPVNELDPPEPDAVGAEDVLEPLSEDAEPVDPLYAEGVVPEDTADPEAGAVGAEKVVEPELEPLYAGALEIADTSLDDAEALLVGPVTELNGEEVEEDDWTLLLELPYTGTVGAEEESEDTLLSDVEALLVDPVTGLTGDELEADEWMLLLEPPYTGALGAEEALDTLFEDEAVAALTGDELLGLAVSVRVVW